MAELTTSILNQDERRDYARLSVDKETQTWVRNTNPFFTSGATDGQSIDGIASRVSDISFSGARIVVPDSCGREGDTIEVRLRRETNEPLILEGRIVRIEPAPDGHAMGVHFYNVAIRDQQRFAEALYGWSKSDANQKGVRRSRIAPMKRSIAV
jgi:hypothetical protein